MGADRCAGWIAMDFLGLEQSRPNMYTVSRQAILSKPSFHLAKRQECILGVWQYVALAHSISPPKRKPYKVSAIAIVWYYSAVMGIVTRKERRRFLPQPEGVRVSAPECNEGQVKNILL